MIFVFFTMIALGLAAPYVLLAANPKLLRFVPKPGGWMETFKQIIGIPLVATGDIHYLRHEDCEAQDVLLEALVQSALRSAALAEEVGLAVGAGELLTSVSIASRSVFPKRCATSGRTGTARW